MGTRLYYAKLPKRDNQKNPHPKSCYTLLTLNTLYLHRINYKTTCSSNQAIYHKYLYMYIQSNLKKTNTNILQAFQITEQP